MVFDLRMFTVGSHRMSALEGLRGLAAYLVVVHHYVNWVVGRLEPGSFNHLFYRFTGHLGGTGVELFFVISGFLIHWILVSKPQNYSTFMKRRLERIMPLAWFCITLALLAMTVRGHMDIPAITGNKLLDIAANYFLIPGVYPVKSIYDVTWTLSYEMLFYAVCPLLVMLYRALNFGALPRVLVSLSFVPLIFWLSSYHFPIAYFVVGILAAEAMPFIKASERLKSAVNWLALIYAIPAIIWIQCIAGEIAHYPFATTEPWTMVQRYIFIGPAFFLLVCATIGADRSLSRFFSATLMRFLGAISYSLYLTHIIVLGPLMLIHEKILPPAGYFSFLEFFGMLAIFSVLAIGFASVTYLMIERPFSLDKKWPWETWRSLRLNPAKA